MLAALAIASPATIAAAAEPVIRICEAARVSNPAKSTLDVADALRSPRRVDQAAFADEPAPQLAPASPLPAANAAAATEGPEEINAQAELTRERVRRPISQITADAALPPGLLPEDAAAKDRPDARPLPLVGDQRLFGHWADKNFQWSATCFCHRPLYFEEVNLERYGYQCHPAVQPFVSGAHFFATVPALPYLMTAQPPHECVYTLGHYRPGSCVPWQTHRPPCDGRAAVVEASVVMGLVFLIP